MVSIPSVLLLDLWVVTEIIPETQSYVGWTFKITHTALFGCYCFLLLHPPTRKHYTTPPPRFFPHCAVTVSPYLSHCPSCRLLIRHTDCDTQPQPSCVRVLSLELVFIKFSFLFLLFYSGFSVRHCDGPPIKCGRGCPGAAGRWGRRCQSYDAARRQSHGQSDVHHGHAASRLAAERTQSSTAAAAVGLQGQPTFDTQFRYSKTRRTQPPPPNPPPAPST